VGTLQYRSQVMLLPGLQFQQDLLPSLVQQLEQLLPLFPGLLCYLSGLFPSQRSPL
jgi:hypothetical protein